MGEEERGRTGKQQIWQEMDVEKERWICGGGEKEEEEGGINIVWCIATWQRQGLPYSTPHTCTPLTHSELHTQTCAVLFSLVQHCVTISLFNPGWESEGKQCSSEIVDS